MEKIAIGLIVISLLLSGCTAESEPKPIEGCMDELATNFDINADVEDDSCEYADSDGDGIFDINEIGGCTDSMADNYDENAMIDDGSCSWTPCSTCAGDMNGDGAVSVGDILAMLGLFGSICSD